MFAPQYLRRVDFFLKSSTLLQATITLVGLINYFLGTDSYMYYIVIGVLSPFVIALIPVIDKMRIFDII